MTEFSEEEHPQEYITDPENSVLAAKGRERIVGVVSGNGVVDIDVKLLACQEAEYLFPAFLITNIEFKLQEKRINGRATGAAKEVAVHDDIIREAESIADDITEIQNHRDYLINIISKEPGQGWAYDKKIIRLAEIRPTFAVTEHCGRCNGTGKEPCASCSGKGRTFCPTCKGLRKEPCPACGGSKSDCHHCHGSGQVQCHKCFGQATIVCHHCAGSGYEQCAECDGTGWHTLLAIVNFEAKTRFEMDLSKLPAELAESIQELGAEALRVGEHAETTYLGDDEEKKDELIMVYEAKIPFGYGDYAVGADKFRTNVVGYNALMRHLPAFMDKLLTPGLELLQNACQGKEAQAMGLIEEAGLYRAVREAISFTSGRTERGVTRKLLQTYPLGMTKEFARDLAHEANLSLQSITRMPRYIGLGVGVLVSGAGYWGYFPGGLHGILEKTLHNPTLVLALDVLVMPILFALTVFSIKAFATKALRQVTPDHMGSPRVGQAGSWGFAACMAIYLFMLEYSVKLGNAPDWFMRLQHKISALIGIG